MKKEKEKEYDLIVYIGRFEPYHIGHDATVLRASELSDTVLVLVGSANGPRTIRNPWNFQERKDMIFANNHAKHLIVSPLNDYTYNEDQWVRNVGAAVNAVKHSDNNPKIAIIGYNKDQTSYYLNKFPQWDFIDMPEYTFFGERVDSTRIRNMMFSVFGMPDTSQDWLPDGSKEMTLAFRQTQDFAKCAAEFNWAEDYKEQFANLKYPMPFTTVDAIVEQSGHILLIMRGGMPGKGLWAMPGGFINKHERLFDAAIRELREETRLKVPEKVLRGSYRHHDYFDDPYRSIRGRTITHAFYFKLDDANDLPRVKGNDDAIYAKWFSFAELSEMEPIMYEDHWHVIRKMMGRV